MQINFLKVFYIKTCIWTIKLLMLYTPTHYITIIHIANTTKPQEGEERANDSQHSMVTVVHSNRLYILRIRWGVLGGFKYKW